MNTTELLKDLAKTKRSQAPLISHLTQIEHAKRDKIRDCGSWLHLREWLEHDCKCTLTNANFCKIALMCNTCAIRRTAMLVGSYTAKAEQVVQDNPHLIPVMITWTVANGDDLGERLSHIKIARQKIGEQARNQRKRKNPPPIMNELTKVLGGVYQYEIKRGKGGRWHPHIHEFALLSDYIDQAKLSAEWQQFTTDSRIVGVTLCKNGILHGMLEVLKYSTKFSEATPADVVEIHDTAKGSRLISNHGILRGVPEPDIDSDEPLDGPYRDYIAMWLFSRNGYELRPYDEIEGTREEWKLSNPHKFNPHRPMPRNGKSIEENQKAARSQVSAANGEATRPEPV